MAACPEKGSTRARNGPMIPGINAPGIACGKLVSSGGEGPCHLHMTTSPTAIRLLVACRVQWYGAAASWHTGVILKSSQQSNI